MQIMTAEVVLRRRREILFFEFMLKFLELHLILPSDKSGFLNCTRVLCTDSHMDENLHFEITEPTEPHIYFLGDTRVFSFIKRYLAITYTYMNTEAPFLIVMKLAAERQTDIQTDSLTRY